MKNLQFGPEKRRLIATDKEEHEETECEDCRKRAAAQSTRKKLVVRKTTPKKSNYLKNN